MDKEYIEREESIILIKNERKQGFELCMPEEWKSNYTAGLYKAIQIVEKIPTADVVEVVRCKNCKHWHEDTGWCYHHSHFIGDNGEFCHPWESVIWKMFDGNDYCSDGEKKEGVEQ